MSTLWSWTRIFAGVFLLSLAGLALVYCSAVRMSRNEQAITLAAKVGGSAVPAVQLAGKTSFLRFLLVFDVSAYVETIWERQRIALIVSQEWTEVHQALQSALEKEQSAKEGGHTSPVVVNPERRRQKLLGYQPSPHQKEEEVQEVRRVVAVAAKVVAAELSLAGFYLPDGLLPSDLSDRQKIVVTDILKTLLAGTDGLSCFGEHRMNETSLRRRVSTHLVELNGSPKTYDVALAWLLRQGVITFLNESSIHSYSIAPKGEVTEVGQPIRAFMIQINQKRRGSSR